MKGCFGHYYVFSFFKLLTFLNVTKCLKKVLYVVICMIFFFALPSYFRYNHNHFNALCILNSCQNLSRFCSS